MTGISERIAIVGVGATAQGDLAGKPTLAIAGEALDLALQDAGLAKGAVDGLVVFGSYGSHFPDVTVGGACGLNPSFSAALTYGSANFSLHAAYMAIASGLATTVAVIYAAANRSIRSSFPNVTGIDDGAVHGLLNVAGPAAMAFRRMQHLYGTTEQQLGQVSVTQRAHARLNPIAFQKKPLSAEDYMASRFLVRPLRRPDLCLVTDGGAAVIVTSQDRARDTAKVPIYLRGISQVAALGGMQEKDHLLRPWLSKLRDVFTRSGVERAEVGALYIQEAASVWVLQMLEALGYCGEGEAGSYLTDVGMGLDSWLPINTNGGHLAESYMLGYLHLIEAVRQLRGECNGRQIAGLEVAQFCSSGGFERGGATILAREAIG